MRTDFYTQKVPLDQEWTQKSPKAQKKGSLIKFVNETDATDV